MFEGRWFSLSLYLAADRRIDAVEYSLLGVSLVGAVVATLHVCGIGAPQLLALLFAR
ncbi:hypothetical protein SAMN05421819_3424 [Bryocella elongata]|uniref:Uncharacterized protein n=1 Tax=Bryocella elongata TaxID=863522 RepID=A0A1H6B300_9BACT|nr:hypothetical protein [Bryocella elongata]SEG54486.1 hypothetical protein SAMN05421819_3424 [Bryocella elongata]